jgi:hypothetical protein
MKRLILPLIVSAVAVLGSIFLVLTPAYASGQICAQSGTGYCLDDWGGGGVNNPVKMDTNGTIHQSFGNYVLTTMCGHGKVTGTCPFSNLALDSALFNEPIEAIKYITNGLCVGSGQNDDRALLEPCPGLNGVGGGWGTIYVQDPGTCITHLDSVHWTNNGGTSTPYDLVSGGSVGSQAVNSTNRTGSSCWGTG